MRQLFLTILIITATSVFALNPEDDPYPDYLEEMFLDMTFEQNLVTPEVPANKKGGVHDFMKNIAQDFQRKLPDAMKSVISVDLMNNSNSAMVITYPCDELFQPNDTLFSKYADKALSLMLPLMKDPFMYKIIYTVHSDDTGSESYRDALTDARMNSVYDWFMQKIDLNKIPEELIIIPESFGSESPKVDNLTRENRRKNRRIEFYFIPGPRLIESV